MINPLSYQPGSKFKGSELNFWCEEQIRNHGSHEAEARRIYGHYTFKDETLYELQRGPFGPGQDPCRDGANPKLTFRKVI